ncbi:hypothetical protein OQX61_00225 [Pedobacter sp. PLR]|uniref:hypothetical protein n=1 Tax=Pedobacter sp. PLR TaxID=2994465 RepID=UPI0022450DA2|nr:hypothetical protein [Pedobacter sp. PLR]MCX2449681.1 hypothetical protein [Pedobacter sp. PLR]
MYRREITSTTTALLLMICTMVCVSNCVRAQNLKDKFRLVNRTVSLEQKSGAVHLNEMDSAGIAWIIGKEFTKGTIEFDLKGKDEFQGSFVGIAFHGLNDTTYESVYFRPFNFRSTDSNRKAHAIQYTALPAYDWPILRENFPNKYEQPISAAIDPNQWFHVKIQISANQVSVYVNGAKQPALDVRSLAHTQGKMIGYWVGNGSGGNWKNLKITPER